MPAIEDVGHQEPAERLEVGGIGQPQPLLDQALGLVERGGRRGQPAREKEIAFGASRRYPDNLAHLGVDPGQSSSWASILPRLNRALKLEG